MAGEAWWQGTALNNLAVAAASSSSLNVNVTRFVVFLLIFYGCTFAVFGFWKKKPAGACVTGTVACFSNGNWAEGWDWKHLMGVGVCLGCAQKQQESFSLSSKLEPKTVLVQKRMYCHSGCRQ